MTGRIKAAGSAADKKSGAAGAQPDAAPATSLPATSPSATLPTHAPPQSGAPVSSAGGGMLMWLLVYLIFVVLFSRVTLFPTLSTDDLWSLRLAGAFDTTTTALSFGISLSIHILPIFAWKRARNLNAKLTRERRIADWIRERTAGFMRRIDEQRANRITGEIERDYELGGDASSVAGQLLREIAQKTNQTRIEPVGMILQPHKDDLYAEVPSIILLQRLSLQLGILFTFVGLILAFSAPYFTGALRSGGAPLDPSELLSALNLAFTTSVAGLLSSIFIMTYVERVRTEYGKAVAALERMGEAVLTYAFELPRSPEIRDQLGATTQVLRNTSDNLAMTNHTKATKS